MGPHLIGLLFIILGLVQKYLPPKTINRWYGYRTPLARSSQQAWDEGNRYSAGYFIKAGTVVLVIGFIINGIMLRTVADPGTQKIIQYVILFGGAIGIGITSTIVTEKYLNEYLKKTPVKKAQSKKRK